MNKLKWTERLGYAAGDVASNLVYQGLGMYILFYWTMVGEISATAAGMILLISRIFDGFTDVFFGNLVDKTKSKYGKARPYLLWLAVPFALSAALTFWLPSKDGGILNVVYAFIAYNLTMTLYTAINIPYGVLSAKMTDDPVERGLLGQLRGLAALVASIVVAIVAPILIESVGYTIAFLILGAIAAIIFLITFATTKERVGSSEHSENVPLKVGLKSLLKNDAWLIMIFAGLLLFSTMTIRQTVTPYYANFILNDPTAVTGITMIGMPGMIISMAISPMFFKKFGKVNTAIGGALAGVIVAIVFFFLMQMQPDNTMLLYAYLAISGFFGFGFFGFFAMVTDTIEYGEWKTGTRVEGLTYSAASVGTKVGGGLAAVIVGASLASAGLIETGGAQPASVLGMTEFLLLWAPPLGLLGIAILLKFNKVDKLYPQIHADLQAKNAGNDIEK